MTEQSEDVIDLTNSFTLVNHQNMKGAVIDLESDSIPEAQTDCIISEVQTECSTSTYTLSKRRTRSNSSAVPTPSTRIEIYDLCTPENKVNKKSEKFTVAQEQTTSTPINNKRNSDMDLKRSCPICFDILGTNPLASTKCGHVFCLQCIAMALRTEPKCPTCRRKLKGVHAVHPIFL